MSNESAPFVSYRSDVATRDLEITLILFLPLKTERNLNI